jgi:hypothetical protein
VPEGCAGGEETAVSVVAHPPSLITRLNIQCWHFVEHFLLLIQAQTHDHLLGRPVPTSVLQLAFPRVELHLAYNALVFVPMAYAVSLSRPKALSPRET